MGLYDDAEVIRTGVWLYAGTVATEVRLVRSAWTSGTGDYEDPPEIQNDRDVPCYVVLWGVPGKRGEFKSASAQSETLEEALREAERVAPGIKWD